VTLTEVVDAAVEAARPSTDPPGRLTGWGQHDDRQRATDAGFGRHITKPVDSEAIEPLLH